MWKFLFTALAPIMLLSTIFMFLLVFLLFIADELMEFPVSIGESGLLLIMIAFILSSLSYLLAYFGGMIAIQLGTNAITCHNEVNPIKMVRSKITKSIRKQILPGIPLYLVFIILPYIGLIAAYIFFVISMETAENMLIPLLFLGLMLLFVPVLYIGVYLLHLTLPVLSHQELTFGQKLQHLWSYIRNNFVNLILYSILVGVVDVLANIILYFPYKVFSTIAIIPLVLGVVLLESTPVFAVLLFFLMVFLLTLVATIYSTAHLFILIFRQAAFSTIYIRWYKSSQNRYTDAVAMPRE